MLSAGWSVECRLVCLDAFVVAVASRVRLSLNGCWIRVNVDSAPAAKFSSNLALCNCSAAFSSFLKVTNYGRTFPGYCLPNRWQRSRIIAGLTGRQVSRKAVSNSASATPSTSFRSRTTTFRRRCISVCTAARTPMMGATGGSWVDTDGNSTCGFLGRRQHDSQTVF